MAYFNGDLEAQLSSSQQYRKQCEKPLVLLALPETLEVVIHDGENLGEMFVSGYSRRDRICFKKILSFTGDCKRRKNELV